jgi:hypothetical protein
MPMIHWFRYPRFGLSPAEIVAFLVIITFISQQGLHF